MRKILWRYLRSRYPYADQARALKQELAHLSEQKALYQKIDDAPAVTEPKLKAIEQRQAELTEELSRLLKPEDVLRQLDLALMSPPERVAAAGDGLYPAAEQNGDLLTTIYALVAEDSVTATCSDSETLLWETISNAMTYAEISKACESRGGRLPTMEDLKGPSPGNIFALESKRAWGAKDCFWFAGSAVGRSLPVMEELAARAMWLAEDQESTIRVALIGPQGIPCGTSGSIRFADEQRAGGVCIRERRDPRGMRDIISRQLPCGKWQ